jgi:dTMP kinase
VCNRYYGSNIGHQGGKVDKKDLPKFLKWLEKLEFKVFGIPKPDITVFLHIPYTLSKFMVSKKPKRGYLKGKSFDIHEQSSEHLKRSFEAYMFALKKYNSWVKIDCTSGGKMLLRNQIADKIWLEVRKKLEWS